MIACHPSVPQRTVLGCGSATTNARCSLAEIRAEKCKIKQAPNLPDWHVAFDEVSAPLSGVTGGKLRCEAGIER